MIPWPALAPEWAAFEARFPERAAGPHAVDAFLADACARGLRAAIDAFEAEHVARIPSFVRRIDPSPAFADEVAQIVRTRLLVPAEDGSRTIGAYDARVALDGWLRVIAVRVALNLKRGERPAVDPDEALADRAADGDPDVLRLRARYKEPFARAFARALSALEPADAAILRLHYLDRVSLDALATMHGAHRATIARRLARVRATLLEATYEALAEGERLHASEIESVVRALQSGLEVSVQRLLREREDDHG